jgi:hypothetical protein
MSHDAALNFWQALMQDKEMNAVLGKHLGSSQGAPLEKLLLSFAREHGWDFGMGEFKGVMAAETATDAEIAQIIDLKEAEILACRLRKSA